MGWSLGWTPASSFEGDPLGDMLCHLWKNGGEVHVTKFVALQNLGVQVEFNYLDLGPIAELFGYRWVPGLDYMRGGPRGTIHIPDPGVGANSASPGTRADRLASFVEEIEHAAQFNDGRCSSTTLMEGELQAKNEKIVWALNAAALGGIKWSDFVHQRQGDLIGIGYVASALQRGVPDFINGPIFQWQDAPGVPSLGYAACPGPVKVPFQKGTTAKLNLCIDLPVQYIVSIESRKCSLRFQTNW